VSSSLTLLLVPVLVFLLIAHLVNGQSSISVSAETIAANSSLPVILIHGYASGPSVWKSWETLLKADNITYKAVKFKDFLETKDDDEDSCGSSFNHAMELKDIIEDFRNDTKVEKVNIVAHSKGGLDARLYLHNDLSNKHVENLIMIGTPNAGSPLAYLNEVCSPAVFDIRPGSDATQARINKNTKYHTIAGNWTPSLTSTGTDPNCLPRTQFLRDFQHGGYLVMRPFSSDGIVPLSSVQSIRAFNNLENSDNCHTDLLGNEEYMILREILLGLE
jgi:pimeloyl-ACP methyl ester carboxylesterase